MQFKKYQQETLTALTQFLTYSQAEGPAKAFARFNADMPYRPLDGLPEAPYVCLRLPTGGGKTILAAKSIQIVGETLLNRDLPFTLWMVTSDPIKQQTVEALKNTRHPYRMMLDEAFNGAVRVFDIEDFADIRPQDIAQNACVVVSTIQSFRVKDTKGRSVYKHHEMMEPHFARPFDPDGLERVSKKEAEEKGLKEGEVKFSFANLMYLIRPIMVVDEAHNVISELSSEVQKRVRPSAVLEFTATPKDRNNILYSVTATALKDEEMIKLPIILRTAPDWQSAVSSSLAKLNELRAKGLKDKDRIRPLILYQAQNKNSPANPDAIKEYLTKVKLVPEDRIRIATGNQRELDGVDLKDPNCVIEHIITIEALKEGWDCPSAYILCATQKVSSETKVEQLLGRVLRMPGAKRRTDPALNKAYAFVSDPSILEVANSLRDKLISMGFTDEEATGNLKTGGYKRNPSTGDLFDQADEEAPVFEHKVEATPENREKLEKLAETGAEVIDNGDGTLTVATTGELSAEVSSVLEEVTPDHDKPQLQAKRAAHTQKVEQTKSLGERGVKIVVPGIGSMVQGELLFAHDDSIFEGGKWSLDNSTDYLTDADLTLRKDEDVVEIDLKGEKLIYQAAHNVVTYLPGFDPADMTMSEAAFVGLLEKRCKRQTLPQDELTRWLAGVVTNLVSRQKMSVKDLVDWEGPIVAAINAKLDALELTSKKTAYQAALFADDADIQVIEGKFEFSNSVYPDVRLDAPPGGMSFPKHLLGSRKIPRIDGKPFGEEMQCAFALDGNPDVEVWIRNVVGHKDSFSLMRPNGNRYFPDFIAKLKDGRIFVIEYKGAGGADRDDTREKALISHVWANKTGNLYAVIEKMKHGLDMSAQIKAHIAGTMPQNT